MSATLSGKFAVYGMDGTLAFTGLVKTANIVKTFSLGRSTRSARLEKNGHIVGGAEDIAVLQMTASFTPYSSDATPTLAEAKALVVLPPILGDITIDDFDITDADGTWTSVGTVTVNPREDGYLEMSVTGERYLQSDGTYKALSQVASA